MPISNCRAYLGLSYGPRKDPVPADVVRTFLESTLPRALSGATYWRARGVWAGATEDSIVIESIGEPGPTMEALRLLGRDWCTMARQESVLITEAPIATLESVSGRVLAAAE